MTATGTGPAGGTGVDGGRHGSHGDQDHGDQGDHGVGSLAGPPRRATARWTAVAVGVLLVGLVVVLATRPSATARLAESPLVGQPAPPLAGQDLLGGGTYDLAASGRWTVVNFFAEWCVPCRQEHPELVSFSRRHAAAGDADVVSVVYSDDADAVRAFFADEGGEWPVLDDPQGRVALDWGVAGVPESYLVAPDGTVVTKIVGGVTSGFLDDVLAQARGGGGG